MVQPSGDTSSLPYPKDLRPKQKEIIEAFGTNTFIAGKLPTGYGKTKAAAGAFCRLYKDNKCNRILVVVPRRSQANQIAEDLPDALKEYGIETQAIIVGRDQINALRGHSSGKILVYIVTIQSLITGKTWETVTALMQTGKWFGYIDEHHHYGNNEEENKEGGWTDALKNMHFTASLVMSATPNRHDGTDHFPEPTIKETYLKAAKEGYIKRLSLHAYHYTIDAVMVDGEIIQLTTEELAKEAGGETSEAIEAFLASRKMRFSPKYISPLVMFPVDRMVDLRTRGIRSQMLVQAISCSHAQCVMQQIKSLIPDHFSVDWVGTGPNGRPEDENDEVIGKFCPKKDKATGKRSWSLDILVNVGMAGEGMDSIDVTEVVFLTPANINISNKQIIGRGSRAMALPKDFEQVCHVNVDTGSPMGVDQYIGPGIMAIFDDSLEIKEQMEEPRQQPPPEYQELPEKLGWMIADCRLTEIRSEPMFKEVFKTTRRETSLAVTDEEVAIIVEKKLHEYLNRSNNQTAIHAQLRDQVDSAVSRIAGLIIRKMAATGMRVEKTLAGDLRTRINFQKKRSFGSTKDADQETLNQHWTWLKALEREILSGHNLEGVPKWLR